MAKEKIVRAQTRREELANTLSHGLGALLALAGAVPCWCGDWPQGRPRPR